MTRTLDVYLQEKLVGQLQQKKVEISRFSTILIICIKIYRASLSLYLLVLKLIKVKQ